MSNQAKALRLADVIETFGGATAYQTAHELRRLHVVNGELLEALKAVVSADDRCQLEQVMIERARAAIAKAEAAWPKTNSAAPPLST